MGWRLKFYGLTVQGLWVDGFKRLGWQFKWLGWRFKCGRRQLYKHLTSCSEAIMAHDTCHSLIGFYLGSKCRFVFRALFLQIPESSLPISSFSAKTYCQSATVILVRSPHSYCYNDRQHIPSVRLVYPSLIQEIGKCSFSKSLADSLFILIS